MKRLILAVVVAMFALAAIASAISTSYVSYQEINNVILINSKAKGSQMALHAEYILENSKQPIDDLQEMVTTLSQRADIAYAIVIDKNVAAVAHSDKQKINRVYKDEYTVLGATQGVVQHSKWYADVQKVWTYDIMSPIYVDGKLYGTLDIGVPITEVDSAAMGIIVTQLATTCGMFVLCIVVLAGLMSKLFQPLTRLQTALEDISKGDGDLTMRLPVKGNDEIAHISTAFNTFVSKINDIIQQVVRTGSELNQSANVVREQSVRALTRGDLQNEQSTLVVTSMNEMVSTINEISTNAAGAAQAAGNVNKETANSSAVLQFATETISNLTDEMNNTANVVTALADRTQSIESILDVIRGISEQTNLLALNAAIEAARAGEAGRGFAVVADEVRNLATKSAQSTGEIQTMIDHLQAEAKSAVTAMNASRELTIKGAEATLEAQQAIKAIAEQVSAILDLNTQVATATEQQSSVTKEINLNMDSLNESVREGLSASQQLEETSKTLTALSQTLDKYAGSFKVGKA